jgi:hypothetical protein
MMLPHSQQHQHLCTGVPKLDGSPRTRPAHRQQQAQNGEREQAMKLQTTRQLYSYWNGLRGDKDVPFRCQIDPADMRAFLPEVFVLSRHSPNSYPFRIAGTALCSYFGRELREADFLDMWSPDEREGLESLLLSITSDCAGAVLGLRAHTADDRSVDLEALLLPLRLNGDHCTQIIGTISPFRGEFWLGHRPLVRQSIQSLRLLWPESMPVAHHLEARQQPLTIAQPTTSYRSGRTHLMVIEGGRSA